MSARRRLLAALALSFAVHVAAVVSPAGWAPSSDEEALPAVALDARLKVSTRRHADRVQRHPGGNRKTSRRTTAPASAPAPVVATPPDALASAPVLPTPADASAKGDGTGATPAPVATAAPALQTPPPAPAADKATDAGTPADIGLPRQGRIDYAISRGERGFVIGRSVHQWQHDGATYSMTSINETTGLVALFRAARASLSSTGEIAADGLVPLEFRGDRGKAIDVARFDWTAGKVTLSADKAQETRLAPGAQDLLSMFYQLGISLRHGGVHDMAVVTGRKYETYAFESVGVEHLALPFGTQRTLHLKTRPVPGADSTEIWLGLDLSNLPLKIRYAERDGEVFYQVAEKIEIGGQVIEKPEQNLGLSQ